MHNLEFNKIVAGFLVASIVAWITGAIADILYEPELNPHRGYQVKVLEQDGANVAQAAPEEFKIDIEELMKNASAENGAEVFKKCSSCHTNNNGGANKVGPNLYAIVGAKQAHLSDYTYSSAMQSAGGIWDHDKLAYFLHNPRKFMSGTKMSFAGLSNPKDIADIIKYLESQ